MTTTTLTLQTTLSPSPNASTPIEIWRSEIALIQPTDFSIPLSTTTTKLQTMRNILKKAIPSSSSPSPSSTSSSPSKSSPTSTSKVPHHHLRPRSLSFHSPISTSSFALRSQKNKNEYERTAMYATSPTSSINSSNGGELLELDEDEEAVSFGDDEEREMGMQGKRAGMGGYERKDSFVEKMERLERARRLLESYGGRC